MKIISNLTKNHYQEIDELLSISDELIIASPYLSYDMGELLGGFENIDKIQSITLITTLKNKSDDLLDKSKSLPTFIDFFDFKKGKWNIHINNKLHGKVYIFKKNSSIIAGIISSANLSENGMRNNHEWGILIKEKNELDTLEKEIYTTIQKYDLTIENIIQLLLEVEKYEANNETKRPNISLDINEILKNINLPPIPSNTKIFLKPIGVAEDPVTESEKYTKAIDKLYFSRRRPVSIEKECIIICYGVGIKKLLSYYEVISDIQVDSNNDRWPYFVVGKNLSIEFGDKWNQYDFYITNLAEEFKSKNPSIPITNVGGFSLGALNFGADKIRLTNEFGNFLISKINNA